jgi:hypothetical protein
VIMQGLLLAMIAIRESPNMFETCVLAAPECQPTSRV